MWRWEWLGQTIMMRPYKSTNFLATFLLLGIMVFTFSACSNDGDESEETASTLQPFAGNWQCLDEEGEYHSILIIYEDGKYQFLYQDGDDKGADTGMMAFDQNLNTMTCSPTLKPNVEYENVYLDYDGDIYKGSYYVSEDKIFLEDATGKDPICDEHQIEELTSKGFVLLARVSSSVFLFLVSKIM